MFKHFIIFLFLLSPTLSFNTIAQEHSHTDSLIRHIRALQVKENGYFLQGSFASQVAKSRKPLKRKNDFNIFYNALIGFTLTGIRDKLSTDEQMVCDSITSGLKGVYPHFRNKNGFNTYNFWRTDTAFMIPYTTWVTVFPFKFLEKMFSKHFYPPDDLDCTSLALLAMNVSDSTAKGVHELMQQYSNNYSVSETENIPSRHCINKRYRNYGAYYVWFGKKQYSRVFDICVLCNILTYVNHYHLPYTRADSESLRLIIAEIKNGDYLKNPIKVAPYYGNTSVIFYHLARLMNSSQIPELEYILPSLILIADSIFKQSTDPFERLLLASSLTKMRVSSQLSVISSQAFQASIEQSNTPFFIANIPESFPYSLQRIFVKMKRGLFSYYCPAYYDCLLLEYLELKNK